MVVVPIEAPTVNHESHLALREYKNYWSIFAAECWNPKQPPACSKGPNKIVVQGFMIGNLHQLEPNVPQVFRFLLHANLGCMELSGVEATSWERHRRIIVLTRGTKKSRIIVVAITTRRQTIITIIPTIKPSANIPKLGSILWLLLQYL